MQEVTRIYNRTLVAVFKENRKVLKEMVRRRRTAFSRRPAIRKYNVMPTLRRLQRCDIDTGHFYVQVTDYLSEVTKALIHITRPAFEHIDNNHEGMSKEQIVDLMRVNDQVEAIFDKINDMLPHEGLSRTSIWCSKCATSSSTPSSRRSRASCAASTATRRPAPGPACSTSRSSTRRRR